MKREEAERVFMAQRYITIEDMYPVINDNECEANPDCDVSAWRREYTLLPL